ncbi:hypothetical protein DY000_02038854 [Brassica cretica]|uniref:Uncharacterized protein n=1 Tax=Brassica cretica TaxID=69181 RepID=A0ABQ7BD08_BRACR|nr:hypothetical protein DY000_02038854 [Brassica cretica]
MPNRIKPGFPLTLARVSLPHSQSLKKKKNLPGFSVNSIFTLFLLTFPLFPSQSPEFAGDRVLTKFWELTHFSFVGTAAAYGLFSRRSVESSVNSRMICVDESSLSYVCSSVFHKDSCNFRSDESHLIQVNARASVYL